MLRETCDRVLAPAPGVSRDKLVMRAVALQLLGDAYAGARKEAAGVLGGVDESEYVRVDTRESKARDAAR